MRIISLVSRIIGSGGKSRVAALTLAALTSMAAVGWIAAQQIRSPAQVAADTAAPESSPITIPVVKRALSTTVIVRGTVRYGAPQAVVLANSRIKQGSGIVTSPPKRGARLDAGEVAMTVDGRPVFILPGAIPMHRDLGRGDRGPDVLQLERFLAGQGLRPGRVDGRYGAATEAAVARMYLRRGRDPFGPTDAQIEQLRTAEGLAAQAKDAHLQAINLVVQARRGATPAEVQQARVDAVNARDALDTAVLNMATAQGKLDTARALARGGTSGQDIAAATNRREQAQADAEVEAKRLALTAASDDERLATLRQAELAIDAPRSEREAAAAAVRQATGALTRAQADLTSAVAAADAVRVSGRSATRRARDEAAQASRDVRLAGTELRRARQAVRTARRLSGLQARRVRLLAKPTDTRSLRAIREAAAGEAVRTRVEVRRLASRSGVQVPADEILFLTSLPLRVDAVKVKRGGAVSGSVMNATNSRLAVDSSLSVADAKLVGVGDPVTIEEQSLGVKAPGIVNQVASTPGTHGVDQTRFYFSVVPTGRLPSLVGASVKLTISVKSTKGSVLAVPVSALSVGGDGESRVQVRRGQQTEIVRVVPGLAAEGLVEVRASDGAQLRPGDLVIVGARGAGGSSSSATAGSGSG